MNGIIRLPEGERKIVLKFYCGPGKLRPFGDVASAVRSL